MKLIYPFNAFLALLFFSCSSSIENKPELHVNISKVTVYAQNPSAQFRALGKVDSSACRLAEAKRAIKREAALLKANSIVNHHCRKLSEKKWSEACRWVYKCSGDAVIIR